MENNSELDFDVVDFVQMLQTLPAHGPISDAYMLTYATPAQVDALEQKSARRAAARLGMISEREHMVAWFAAQDTRVQNTGQDPAEASAIVEKRNRRSAKRAQYSARLAYQRLQNPRALLWIAEAIGVPTEIVEAAASAAVTQEDRRSRCRVLREYLPWEMIAQLAQPRIAQLRAQAALRESTAESEPAAKVTESGVNPAAAAPGNGGSEIMREVDMLLSAHAEKPARLQFEPVQKRARRSVRAAGAAWYQRALRAGEADCEAAAGGAGEEESAGRGLENPAEIAEPDATTAEIPLVSPPLGRKQGRVEKRAEKAEKQAEKRAEKSEKRAEQSERKRAKESAKRQRKLAKAQRKQQG